MRIPFEKLNDADLIVDAVYESDRNAAAGALSAEPLSKLMGVGNMGGFRNKKGKHKILFSVLTSSGYVPEWPDTLDPFRGTYTYYGDNRIPGKEMHATKQRGNELLREAFQLANEGSETARRSCPIFFIFEATGYSRDFVFRGLAVPGANFKQSDEGLVAVWRSANGQRFQNYRATFSILDEAVISRVWLQQCAKMGELDLDSESAPKALVRWIRTGKISPLISQRTEVRSSIEQLPSKPETRELLDEVLDFCDGNPFLFEPIAAELWRACAAMPIDYQITRKFRDGGRDAIGHMFLGPSSDPIRLEFALEAKLYDPKNSVGVKEISRLVSRLKHREFGVLVTTSTLNSQAYKEIRHDNHPIVVISGVDIVSTLLEMGNTTKEQVRDWLVKVTEARE